MALQSEHFEELNTQLEALGKLAEIHTTYHKLQYYTDSKIGAALQNIAEALLKDIEEKLKETPPRQVVAS